jgi:hypothetical protein
MSKHFVLAALVAVALGCHSPTAPETSQLVDVSHGRLSGLVTIGPNCPVERPDEQCPTQPSAYASRKVLVYDEAHSKLLYTVDIDSHGLYVIDLTPARYAIDLQRSGVDRSGQVPTVVTITANGIVQLDISIDTGIR